MSLLTLIGRKEGGFSSPFPFTVAGKALARHRLDYYMNKEWKRKEKKGG